MVALRSQGNWRWEGPLGTPIYKKKTYGKDDTLTKLLNLIYVFQRFNEFLVGCEKQYDKYYYHTSNQITVHNISLVFKITTFLHYHQLQ